MEKESKFDWKIMFVVIPILVGVIVSISGPSWLVTEDNEWIGFWGGYAGALIGAWATVHVMKITLKHDKEERIYREQYEIEERNRKERIEIALKINELVMEYASKAVRYPGLYIRKDITSFDRIAYVNDLFKYSGIINSIIGAINDKEGYQYTEEMKAKSERLVSLLGNCEETMIESVDIDKKKKAIQEIVEATQELRECSAEFLEKNLI